MNLSLDTSVVVRTSHLFAFCWSCFPTHQSVLVSFPSRSHALPFLYFLPGFLFSFAPFLSFLFSLAFFLEVRRDERWRYYGEDREEDNGGCTWQGTDTSYKHRHRCRVTQRVDLTFFLNKSNERFIAYVPGQNGSRLNEFVVVQNA